MWKKYVKPSKVDLVKYYLEHWMRRERSLTSS